MIYGAMLRNGLILIIELLFQPWLIIIFVAHTLFVKENVMTHFQKINN
jgi:hypothetical protein